MIAKFSQKQMLHVQQRTLVSLKKWKKRRQKLAKFNKTKNSIVAQKHYTHCHCKCIYRLKQKNTQTVTEATCFSRY